VEKLQFTYRIDHVRFKCSAGILPAIPGALRPRQAGETPA
jgi:hypothetical protein